MKNPFGGGKDNSSSGKNPFDHNRSSSTKKDKEAPKSNMTQSSMAKSSNTPRKNPFDQYKHGRSAKVESSSSQVIGHSVSSDTYDKRVNLVQHKMAEEKAAKEQAARQEQQRLNKAKSEQAAQQNKKIAEQQKTAAEQQQENTFRAQARDLKNQIAYWQQQLGRNPESDFQVNATIAELTGKLNGIPTQYWN